MKFILQAILTVVVAMTPVTADVDKDKKFPFPIGTGPYNPFPDDFDGLSIGQVHNLAVQYYYDTAANEEEEGGGRMLKQTAEKQIAKATRTMYKFAVKSGYLTEQDAASMMTDYDFGIKGNKLGYKVIESHLSNPALEKGIADVVAMAEAGASIEEMIDAVVAEVIPFADAGNVQAQVFVDVLENSFDYWTNNAGSNRKLLKDSSVVIAADAVGALHGLILGPIVSIIEGAVVSIAKNEGWF